MEGDQLIGVYVRQIDFIEPSFFLCEPLIEGYLFDKKTSKCIKGSSSSSNIYSYKSPFALGNPEVRSSRTLNWNKLIVIEGSFSELTSESKRLFFELTKMDWNHRKHRPERKRMAWAFLRPLSSDGSMNTNKDLKLQLYEVRKNCKISHQDCDIYHLYSKHKLKKLFGTLEVSVKGVLPTEEQPEEKEEDLKEEPTAEENVKKSSPPQQKSISKPEWSRLPHQSCKVPNKIYRIHNVGQSGISCLKFSRNGIYIAAGVLSHILIQEVITGEEVAYLKSHVGYIYEIDWSLDDQYLLSVSNDCIGAVWSLSRKTPLFVLPHPCYIYCGKWFQSDEIITGGKDHFIRHWRKSENEFELIQEIPGHSGFVNCLATQDDSIVLSGDSRGCVLIRRYANDAWTLIKEINIPEAGKNVIDSIHINPTRRRIIVSIRSRGCYLVDDVSGVVLQKYESAVNAFARSSSALSPCGSFLFSFCQYGSVGVWEVNTGSLFATYDNLFPIDYISELSVYIHYHPHEHLLAIGALGQSHPLILLKYDVSKPDDSEKLGLKYVEKKVDSVLTENLLAKFVKLSL